MSNPSTHQSSFTHFGCWASRNRQNQIANTYTYGVDEVMKLLNTHSAEVDFCIVSGDNYYANRETDTAPDAPAEAAPAAGEKIKGQRFGIKLKYNRILIV